MDNELRKRKIGDLEEGHYWSSTEVPPKRSQKALVRELGIGNQQEFKDCHYLVRPVRTFELNIGYNIGDETTTGIIFDKTQDKKTHTYAYEYTECKFADESHWNEKDRFRQCAWTWYEAMVLFTDSTLSGLQIASDMLLKRGEVNTVKYAGNSKLQPMHLYESQRIEALLKVISDSITTKTQDPSLIEYVEELKIRLQLWNDLKI